MTDLGNLIHRLEAAETGSRELDARMYALLCTADQYECMAVPNNHQVDELSFRWEAKSGRVFTCWRNKAFTRSQDAITALIEEKLPGCSVDVNWRADDAEASIVTFKGRRLDVGDIQRFGRGKTAPLALCIAFLRAYQAQEATDG